MWTKRHWETDAHIVALSECPKILKKMISLVYSMQFSERRYGITPRSHYCKHPAVEGTLILTAMPNSMQRDQALEEDSTHPSISFKQEQETSRG